MLVGDVVDVGADRAFAKSIHDKLAAHARLRHLASAITFGYEDSIREGEGLTKLAVEAAGARVAVRLEDRYQTTLGRARCTGYLEGRRELCRVVGVIVYDPDLGTLPFELKASPHAREALEARGGVVSVVAEPAGHAGRGQRVQ